MLQYNIKGNVVEVIGEVQKRENWVVLFSADQKPLLSYGILRALIAGDVFGLNRIWYAGHDLDGESVHPTRGTNIWSKEGRLALVGLRAGQLFMLHEKRFPFAFPALPPKAVLAEMDGLMNNPEEVSRSMSRLLNGLPDWRVAITSPENTPYIRASLTVSIFPELKVLVHDLYTRLTLWYERLALATSCPEQIWPRILVLKHVISNWLMHGDSLWDLTWGLCELALNTHLPARLKLSTFDLVTKERWGLRMMKVWLKEPLFREVYLEHSRDTKLAEKSGSQPFFVIVRRSDGCLIRIPLEKEIPSKVNPEKYLSELEFEIMENGQLVTFAPKALLFLVDMMRRNVAFSGGISYQHISKQIADASGMKIYPHVKISGLQPGSVLKEMGVIPDMNTLWNVSVPTDARRPSMFKLLEVLQDLSYKYWMDGENIDLLTVWVLGGREAVQRILTGATIEID